MITLEKLEDKASEQSGELVLEGSNSCEDFEWEDLTDSLSELMKKINPGGYWFAKVSNFGWRSIGGHAFIRADNGRELLSKILPNTECNFKIHRMGKKGIAINNAHHDSPCYAEWYSIIPITSGTYHDYKGG